MTKPSAQDTKNRICEAAIIEIARRGWTGVRTRGVARRAGVNNALVHYHFGSMERLLVEATRTALAGIEEGFGGLPAESTVADAMRSMVQGISGYDLDDPQVVVVLEALLHAPRNDEIAELIDGVVESYRRSLEEVIAAGIASGELGPATDAAGLAVALTALADGLALHRYAHPGLDVERAVGALVELWGRR